MWERGGVHSISTRLRGIGLTRFLDCTIGAHAESLLTPVDPQPIACVMLELNHHSQSVPIPHSSIWSCLYIFRQTKIFHLGIFRYIEIWLTKVWLSQLYLLWNQIEFLVAVCSVFCLQWFCHLTFTYFLIYECCAVQSYHKISFILNFHYHRLFKR